MSSFSLALPKVLRTAELAVNDFLTEKNTWIFSRRLPKENQYLDDKDPNKFVAKMGAEALHDMLANLDLDELSYNLRHRQIQKLHSSARARR